MGPESRWVGNPCRNLHAVQPHAGFDLDYSVDYRDLTASTLISFAVPSKNIIYALTGFLFLFYWFLTVVAIELTADRRPLASLKLSDSNLLQLLNSVVYLMNLL